jgi:AcrR family transcriptional regulator
MDEIAREAGVGKPTLYRYFPAKDELFLAVFDALLTDLEGALSDILAAGRSPEDTITEMIRVLVARLSTRLASLSILGGDQAGVALSTRRLFAQRRQSLIELLARALTDGRAAGVFRAMDVAASAPLLLGLIRGGLLAAPDLPPERMAAAATEMILRGALNRP